MILTNSCNKAESDEVLNLDSTKNYEPNKSRLRNTNNIVFCSSVGFENNQFYKMIVEGGDILTINRTIIEEDTIKNTNCNFVGNFKVTNINRYIEVSSSKSGKYFFIPYNPIFEPVSIVKGGVGVRLWCQCNSVDLKKVGLCLTHSTIERNIATVNCSALQCEWCELKQAGSNDYAPTRYIDEFGLGTFIEAEKINVDGKVFEH